MAKKAPVKKAPPVKRKTSKGGRHHSDSVKKTEIAVRRDKVIALHLAHQNYAQIAKRLGVSLSTVDADVMAVRKQLNASAKEKLLEYKERNDANLNALYALLQSKISKDAEVGEGKVFTVDVQLVREARGVLSDQAKLWGLNAPKAVEHSGALPLRIIMDPFEEEDEDEDD